MKTTAINKSKNRQSTPLEMPNAELLDDSTWQTDVLGEGFTNTTLTTVDGAQVTLIKYEPDAHQDGGDDTGGDDVGGGAAPLDNSGDASGGDVGGGYDARGDDARGGGDARGDEAGGSDAPVDDSGDKVAILYVHGFSDYFFQTHVAQALTDAGYAFYAVDLRGYGRSMASHMEAGGSPNMVDELALHGRDLDAAVAAVKSLGHQQVVIMAHSMGGLVASLWAATRPGQAAALVLNAPWFDLNENWLLRGPGTLAIKLLAEFAPTVVVGGLKPHYGKALHQSTGGQWDYSLDWKPFSGFPVQAGWMASARRDHRRLNAGLDLEIPVLVLASTRSGDAKMWHPRLTRTDSVLDVDHIAKGAAQLGSDVTFVQITGGAHDLALSHTPAAREDYLAAVIGWLNHLFHREKLLLPGEHHS